MAALLNLEVTPAGMACLAALAGASAKLPVKRRLNFRVTDAGHEYLRQQKRSTTMTDLSTHMQAGLAAVEVPEKEAPVTLTLSAEDAKAYVAALRRIQVDDNLIGDVVICDGLARQIERARAEAGAK